MLNLCTASRRRAIDLGLGFVAACFILADSPLWAQAKPPVAPPSKSYAMAYLVVVLLVALGLIVVLRGGGRSDEPQLPDLE